MSGRILAKVISLTALLAIVFSYQNCGQSGDDGVFTGNSQAVGQVTELSEEQAKAIHEGLGDLCGDLEAQAGGFALSVANSTLQAANNTLARIDELAVLQGSGNTVIFGNSATARIDSVQDYSGNLSLCDASITGIDGAIANVEGNILIDGGGVAEINGMSGNLVIIGGGFPDIIQGFTGNIVVRASDGSYQGKTYLDGFNP